MRLDETLHLNPKSEIKKKFIEGRLSINDAAFALTCGHDMLQRDALKFLTNKPKTERVG